MNIKIKETGECKELSIRENGIEWTQDLIGNAGAMLDGQFDWSEADNAYIVDQGTYDWWLKYISDLEQTDRDVRALANEFGMAVSDINERIGKESNEDYEVHRNDAVRIMDEIRTEKEAAAANKLAELLKEANAEFNWDTTAKTWCLSGTNHDGNGWETDDYEAANRERAEYDAIEYLIAYNEKEPD